MPEKVNAETAIKSIPRGQRFFIGSGAAVPQSLVQAMVDFKDHFRDNEIVHLLTLGGKGFAREEYTKHFRDNSFFIGTNVRNAVQEGHADYTPIFLSEIPALLRSPSFPLAAALVCVSPPDQHGMCSMGVSVDIVKAAVDSAKFLIAEINPNMPRTFGNSFIPYKAFKYVVESDFPIPELPPAEMDKVFEAIGRNVAALIKDGCVLQMGIGSIPDATLRNLGNRNDLGVHTEMFSDGIIDLMDKGNINNKTKKVVNGRTLTSFCFGTRRLYDFVHENPMIEFYPTEFTNDPFIIAQNDDMVSINSALQVDLTGQVCADSIGHKFYSGIGGQVDFVRGAGRSKGGKAIIALPSTAKNDTISRIVGQLSSGAGVVTSRGDVQYVATEYGIAYLHGKSIRQRATELIQIAHPKFRDELLDFVKNNKYVYFDQRILQEGINYPKEEEEVREFRGTKFRIRPVKISDERKLQSLLYSLDKQALMERFLFRPTEFTREAISQFVYVDYRKDMAFCVFEQGDFDSRLVGFTHYGMDEVSSTAEVDFVVSSDCRGKGIGKYLMQKMFNYAKKNGIQTLKAKVLVSNMSMRHIFNAYGDHVKSWESKTEGDLTTYTFQL